MRRSAIVLILMMAMPLAAQTETIVGGVIADSSVVAPVLNWTRVTSHGDTWALSVDGRTIAGELTHRIAPRTRLAGSLAVSPLHAHASDRIYAGGERRPELEFDDTSVEATFGRIDLPHERWLSDVRVVALYEHVRGTDAATQELWSSPYAGIRTRQAYRRITAEDPLLQTFEGHEVSAFAEIFAGNEVWSRVSLSQRASRRFGKFRAGESVVAFHGRSLNVVNAFLVGASWPVGDLRPLYGYRYAELRLDRGLGMNGDVAYLLPRDVVLTAHVSVLRSRGFHARGAAVDVSAVRRGIAFRVGVGVPADEGRIVVYASVLGAMFLP